MEEKDVYQFKKMLDRLTEKNPQIKNRNRLISDFYQKTAKFFNKNIPLRNRDKNIISERK